MSRSRFVAVWVLMAVLLARPGLAREADAIRVGPFSSASAGGALPEGWRPLEFSRVKEHTHYRLVEDEEAGGVVVRAESRDAASGLRRAVDVDPDTHPILEWRWRISRVFEQGDVTRKAGDDYPARIYVAFAYDPERASFFERVKFEALRIVYGEYPPRAAINYIWASHSAIGTMVANPHSERARMIVVESGAERAGQWRSERRDVAADYQRAFGEPVPRISGVAIMTDTDDTGESAVSWFGDIVFRRAEP